jgi:basic amino acid/polyamine antiporter, APA family
MTQPSLQRQLGLWSTISIVAGGVIGSGIFMKPSVMAAQLGSPILLLAIWVIAGIITLFGALTNAEVAAMFPYTGGQYIFFKKMYGDFFAFLYGWAAFAVFNTAGVASIAYVLAQYFEYFVELPKLPSHTVQALSLHIPFIGRIYPLENIGVKGLTILTVFVLTYINSRSVRFGAGIQVLFTVMKIAAMLLLVGGILFSSKGSFSNILDESEFIRPAGRDLLNACVAAIAGAFWAYDGWNNISFVAGEIKHPQKNIPRALFCGLILCIVLYLLMNIAYAYVLPVDTMAASKVVAADAATIIVGVAGGALISLLVIISTFGTTNGNILATARVSFAMAREKRFFAFAGNVHPKFKTPANALWIHCIWTIMLVFTGSFDMLTDMLIFVSWLFYGMSALGVFILRYKFPEHDRPYKVWGYPIVPSIFILFTAFFLVLTVANDIRLYNSGQSELINSAFGLLLILPGVPLYLYFRNRFN